MQIERSDVLHEAAMDLFAVRHQQPIRILAIVVLVISLTGGCGTPYVLQHTGTSHDGKQWTDIHENVIAIDRDGCPRDVVNVNKPPLSEDQFDADITRIFDAMDRYHAQKPGQPKRILIFIHGGLNSPSDSLTNADKTIDLIKSDPANDGVSAFPIFITWNSDLWDSYSEHLTSVTQGCKQYDAPFSRACLSPLYLFADLGRAISRSPVVWSHQIGSDVSAVRADAEAMQYSKEGNNEWVHSLPQDNTRKVFLRLNQKYKADEDRLAKPTTQSSFDQMQVSIGDDHLNKNQLIGLTFAYVITSPFKFGLSWLLDGLGKPAWDNMCRRTFMPFEGLSGGNMQYSALSADDLSNARSPGKGHRLFLTKGALQVFIERLANKIDAKNGNKDYEITLIGHSMGTMVLNEWIRRNPNIHYTNIVYMAAACTVRSFTHSVIPYLEQSTDTRFFNLTLHPEADLRERRRADDIPPRGSLLVWIDDFLSDPQTPFDRTLGRWESLPLVDNVLPDNVRGRVTFKAFARNLDDNDDDPRNWNADPQTHGGFTEKLYWLPKFWTAAPARTEDDPLVRQANRIPK